MAGPLRRLAEAIPRSRLWLKILIMINLLGSLYGFNWYYHQLRSTPIKFWPVVPDSPLSTLLFSFLLIVFYFGRRSPLLEGIAYLSMIKYGLWTVVVFIQYWVVRQQFDFESIHLSLSHLGMAIEAIIFMRVFSPSIAYAVVGVLWLLFNDYMDYVRGFHPNLPAPELETLVGWTALALTSVAAASFFVFRNRLRSGLRLE